MDLLFMHIGALVQRRPDFGSGDEGIVSEKPDAYFLRP
jgi:hypothetical protein